MINKKEIELKIAANTIFTIGGNLEQFNDEELDYAAKYLSEGNKKYEEVLKFLNKNGMYTIAGCTGHEPVSKGYIAIKGFNKNILVLIETLLKNGIEIKISNSRAMPLTQLVFHFEKENNEKIYNIILGIKSLINDKAYKIDKNIEETVNSVYKMQHLILKKCPSIEFNQCLKLENNELRVVHEVTRDQYLLYANKYNYNKGVIFYNEDKITEKYKVFSPSFIFQLSNLEQRNNFNNLLESLEDADKYKKDYIDYSVYSDEQLISLKQELENKQQQLSNLGNSLDEHIVSNIELADKKVDLLGLDTTYNLYPYEDSRILKALGKNLSYYLKLNETEKVFYEIRYSLNCIDQELSKRNLEKNKHR